jgi:hypothetical protein
MKRTFRLTYAILAVLILAGCGGDDDSGPIAPTVGKLHGTWTGCLTPNFVMSLNIQHGVNASSFTGSVTLPTGTFPISGGIVTGTSVQFGVTTPVDVILWSGALTSADNKATGLWVNSTLDETLVLRGEFQMVKDGSGATGGCTVFAEQLFPDLRLEGQLAVNTTGFYVQYSGTIKNYGLAAAEDPQVAVSTYDTTGTLLETTSTIFVTSLLSPDETANFQLFTSVPSTAFDSASVAITYDAPGKADALSPFAETIRAD